MGVKVWLAKQLYRTIAASYDDIVMEDAPATKRTSTGSSGGGSKARDLAKGIVKILGLRLSASGGGSSKDFEAPEDDLTQVTAAYATDSYVRQGVDKYIDQIFKEGYEIFGKNPTAVEYLKSRLDFIAEGTGIPTGQLFQEIADDIVKYSNCILVKARMSDPAQLPPTAKVTGLNGMEPIVGYFPINVTTMKIRRDKNGMVQGWQQEVEGGDKPVKFKKEDVVHIYYKRVKGNAFGTPFMMPVLDDVRALRQAEENVLRLMYRSIYPFYHMAVGDDETPGTPTEVQEVQDTVNNMDVEGGIATTNRVQIKPIASNQVINAQPYLKYFEERVFSGMGIPAIMFGRGNTANRNTGDNMTAEMGDRIKAMQNTIEMFVNDKIFKELLMEGGFDPLVNPLDSVVLRFHENDLDRKTKAETHAIYKYEHNSITEDEMRALLGMDPITDRALMYINLIEIPKLEAAAEAKAMAQPATATATKTAGTKATNNKQKPTNQSGTKSSPKKQTNADEEALITDRYKLLRYAIDDLLKDDFKNDSKIKDIQTVIRRTSAVINELSIELYKDKAEIAQIYYTRLFKQLHDDIIEYIGIINDVNEIRAIISTTLDIFEDKLHDIINSSTLEGKEEQPDET